MLGLVDLFLYLFIAIFSLKVAVFQIELAFILFKISLNHGFNKLFKAHFGLPAQVGFCFSRIAKQKIDLCRAKITGSIWIIIFPLFLSYPFSCTPLPFQPRSMPTSLKASSTNSLTLWVTPVAIT